jgi:AraC family transcriptional regulator
MAAVHTHQYVSAKRLEIAKALLVRGDKSLADIALALNFSGQANFTRAFSRLTGRTPGQYRRSLGSSGMFQFFQQEMTK